MVDDPQKDVALEALFNAAQANPAAPRAEFVARLMADADASVTTKTAKHSPKTVPLWTRLTQNWLPASGLTAATVLGLWIGILLPETQIAETWLADDASDVDLTAFLPGADLSEFTDPEGGG
jgi:hypothetical protein